MQRTKYILLHIKKKLVLRLYSLSVQSQVFYYWHVFGKFLPILPSIVVWTGWSRWQSWSLLSCASEVPPRSGIWIILFFPFFLSFGKFQLFILQSMSIFEQSTNYSIVISAHFLYDMAESSSDLMWVEAHNCCNWKGKCIFLGKRHKWATWAWGYHWPVITSTTWIHLSELLGMHSSFT